MSSSEIPNFSKHHFDPAGFTVARLEEASEVTSLYADLVSTYRPVNSQELFALERMALCQQAMLRAARLESGLFTSCMNESFGPEGAPSLPFRQEMAEGIEITRQINRNFILADGFRLLARQANSIPLFLRYQVQVERLYRRAVEEFERLKKLRPELLFEANPNDGPPPAEPPKPQSDEPLPALDPSPSNGHQAKIRHPSARCRRPVAPANDVGRATEGPSRISSRLLVPPAILAPVLFALYRRQPCRHGPDANARLKHHLHGGATALRVQLLEITARGCIRAPFLRGGGLHGPHANAPSEHRPPYKPCVYRGGPAAAISLLDTIRRPVF